MQALIKKVLRYAFDHAEQLGALDRDGKVNFLCDFAVKTLDDLLKFKPGLEQLSDVMIRAFVSILVKPEVEQWVDDVWYTEEAPPVATPTAEANTETPA